ncbi:type II secretory pathway, component PulF [Halobacteroides halobius DSM 5150]|uniref:Type II secretory pathway, component PulF n=1 Tax=Halobacteroides halobius (strain ATCC 35273 / DSM 5150 / MD-1) TaxID=748449 RepID=L0KB12_HALHC|nr:type II secretion system F family protein [Halobacteroides halobius]AGB41725.1 type II secretory pathway, component PulF [Halobacteroides halobius DSM 5150]
MTPRFDYKARDQVGNLVDGVIEARNKDSAVDQLREQGYYLTRIEEKSERKNLGKIFKQWRRVKLKDLSIFCRQFATMINSGLSLVRTLGVLKEQTPNPKLKEAVSSIKEEVEKGTALSEALVEQEDIFSKLFISMVRVGETGGVLDNTLEEMANYFEREREIQQKVTSALVYPAVITLISVNVVVFLVTFILPTFVGMFAQFDVRLPLITRALLALSTFLGDYWYVVILAILISGLVARRYYQTTEGQRKVDALLLRIPVISNLIIKVSLGRLSKTLGVLLESGVSILEGLDVVSNVVTNQVITDKIIEARENISQGQSMVTPLEKSTIFPQMFLQMIELGEETGTLAQMLNKVADFYDREVEYTIEQVVSLLEPVLILLLGLVVGGIVTSVMMPLFNLMQGI